MNLFTLEFCNCNMVVIRTPYAEQRKMQNEKMNSEEVRICICICIFKLINSRSFNLSVLISDRAVTAFGQTVHNVSVAHWLPNPGTSIEAPARQRQVLQGSTIFKMVITRWTLRVVERAVVPDTCIVQFITYTPWVFKAPTLH